jgi:hypothetical protein
LLSKFVKSPAPIKSPQSSGRVNESTVVFYQRRRARTRTFLGPERSRQNFEMVKHEN